MLRRQETQVDLRSNDSNSEASSVESTDSAEGSSVCDLVTLTVAAKALPGGRSAIAKGSLDGASAARRSIASENSDCNHGTAAECVEDQANKGEEGLAAQAACEDHGADGVQDCGTRETFNSLLPARDGDIAVSLNGEEVGIDSKNDRSATELQSIESRRDELKSSTAKSHDERSGDDHRNGEVRLVDKVLKVD